MAHRTDSAAAVVDQENLIRGVVKHFLQKVYGPGGMPRGARFSDMEKLAVQIGLAVSRSIEEPIPGRTGRCRARGVGGLWRLRRSCAVGSFRIPHHHGRPDPLEGTRMLLP